MADNQDKITFAVEGLGDGHKQWKMETADGTLKALETPLAKEYLENLLLQKDMNDSLAAMEVWQRRFASSSDPEERLIGASLFRDSIVQFVGCFDKTAQFPLSAEAIYGHDPNGMPSFQWFKDTRDAFAGHKFGAQRQCKVGVVFNTEGKKGIGHLLANYRGQKKEDGDQLRAFMQTAANYLDAHVETLRKRLSYEIQKLSADEIAALKDASARTLKMNEARLTRADLLRDKPAPKR
jgi:hypothetical protein